MSQTNTEMSRIDVLVTHSPFAFIYALFTPTITINNQYYRRKWGKHTFDLVPGNYEIAVSYPWLFSQECGRNSVNVSLQPGETKTITYCAGLIRYLPGKMTVK